MDLSTVGTLVYYYHSNFPTKISSKILYCFKICNECDLRKIRKGKKLWIDISGSETHIDERRYSHVTAYGYVTVTKVKSCKRCHNRAFITILWEAGELSGETVVWLNHPERSPVLSLKHPDKLLQIYKQLQEKKLVPLT